MTKTVLYRYLGTNGVIESPIHLEDIYSTRINILTADEGKNKKQVCVVLMKNLLIGKKLRLKLINK